MGYRFFGSLAKNELLSENFRLLGLLVHNLSDHKVCLLIELFDYLSDRALSVTLSCLNLPSVEQCLVKFAKLIDDLLPAERALRRPGILLQHSGLSDLSLPSPASSALSLGGRASQSFSSTLGRKRLLRVAIALLIEIHGVEVGCHELLLKLTT